MVPRFVRIFALMVDVQAYGGNACLSVAMFIKVCLYLERFGVCWDRLIESWFARWSRLIVLPVRGITEFMSFLRLRGDADMEEFCSDQPAIYSRVNCHMSHFTLGTFFHPRRRQPGYFATTHYISFPGVVLVSAFLIWWNAIHRRVRQAWMSAEAGIPPIFGGFILLTVPYYLPGTAAGSPTFCRGVAPIPGKRSIARVIARHP